MRVPGAPGRRRLTVLVAIVSALAVAATGCSRTVELPGGQRGAAGRLAAGRFATGPTVCALLSIEEVEVAVNAPVAEAPVLARPILAGMSMCALARSSGSGPPRSPPASTPDNPAAANWGVLSPKAGPAFQRYRSWQADHLDRLKVSGHEALWDGRLRTLVILAEDRVFGIRLSAPHPVLGSGQHRAAYFRGTAVRLANLALQRL